MCWQNSWIIFMISLLLVPGNKCWSVTYIPDRICALKGSSVEMSCTYTYPSGHTVITTYWHLPQKQNDDLRQEIKYKDRVEYLRNEENKSTLRIQDLRESDSERYSFRMITNVEGGKYSGQSRVSLTVTDVLNPNCWGLTYTNQSICALKGSSVDIGCQYTYPNAHTVTKAVWYTTKNTTFKELSQDEQQKGRVKYLGDKKYTCSLRITDLRESDSAEYFFRFETSPSGKNTGSPGVTLSLTDLQVKVTGATIIGRQQRVTLNCSTSCTLGYYPTYIWYKNGTHLSPPEFTSVLDTFISEGRYYCAVRGHEKHPSPHVYSPKSTSVSVSSSGEIVEGSSVTLTCSSDANPPVHMYTWYERNGSTTFQKGTGQSLTLVIRHSVLYHCEAKNALGSQKSTEFSTIVTGNHNTAKYAAAGITVVVALVLVPGILWMRKRHTNSTKDTRTTEHNRQGDSSPVYANVSALTPDLAQRADTDDQDDVHYASVHVNHSHRQEVPLYSTVQLPQTLKQEEGVQYAAVNVSEPSAAIRPLAADAADDSSLIYSKID